MKKLIIAFLLSFFCHLFALQLFAQANQSFLYGTITTYDRETYTGQIRWGEEEAFWTDHFDAEKLFNDHIDHLSEKEMGELAERKISNWGNYNGKSKNKEEAMQQVSFVHQLSCRFGEIKSLDIRRIDKVEVTFRDGSRFRVSGDGYNDIGTEIIMFDPVKGEIEFDWLEVLNIEFKSPPADFKSSIGNPLYGKVKTSQGEFKGYVQWDKDERVSIDRLDGTDENGKKHKIEFGEVASIARVSRGSRVVLFSGEEYVLRGTNDVNSQNRGIVVSNPDFGRVVIDWDDFEEVQFAKEMPANDFSYADFKMPKAIAGEVKMKNGAVKKGKIVFDLDEAFDFEHLNGEVEQSEYSIPFRSIRQIIPNGRKESKIILRSNKELMLTSSQDVNSKNDGLLIFENGNEPVYVGWDDLESITLD